MYGEDQIQMYQKKLPKNHVQGKLMEEFKISDTVAINP